MKKYIYLIGAIFSSALINAQVGINTGAPKTTMDISAKRNSGGTITDNTQSYGLQAPRLTRAELTANTATYGTDQNGALIYITDVSGGNATAGSQREYITAAGYYYFDAAANKWQKVINSNTQTVYNAGSGLTMTGNNVKLGGTLTESTTVNQGNNPLTFTGASNVNIKTTGSSVYPLAVTHPLGNNRPGLWIGGESGTPAVGQATYIGLNPNNSQGAWPISLGAEYINSSTGQGSADFYVATSGGGSATKKLVVKNGGNVGIGTTAPTEKLEVNGKIKIDDLPVNGTGGFTATKTLVADNNGVVGTLNSLPPAAYNGYNLTGLQGFKSSNATSRVYSYENIVSNNMIEIATGLPSPYSYAPNPSIIFNPIYTITFDTKSSNADKYILLNTDYRFRAKTGGSTMAKATYTEYDLLIFLNNQLINTFSSVAQFVQDGYSYVDHNKSLIIDLSNQTILPTNNKFMIIRKIA